jgi:hypothetical protein
MTGDVGDMTDHVRSAGTELRHRLLEYRLLDVTEDESDT